jgi:hypothetical protein
VTDVGPIHVEGPYFERRFVYRALALAIAGAQPPAGAVFESQMDRPTPTISVRPAQLLGGPGPLTVPGARGRVGGPIPAAPEPPPTAFDRFGVLAPERSEAVEPRWTRPSVSPAHASLDPWASIGGWSAVQVLWVLARSATVHVAVRFRVAASTREGRDRLFDALGARVRSDWVGGTRVPVAVRDAPVGTRRDWRRGGLRSLRRSAWCAVPPTLLEETPELGFRDHGVRRAWEPGHTVVFGSSGAGKTTFLARRAREAILAGQSVVVLDLHGDLAPSILGALTAAERLRLVAIDASASPVAGISGLTMAGSSVDRAAGQFVAAVKRLTPDGAELAWGFRLERIFDTFSRLVLESGGTLLDLYALLTDPRRRDAALLQSTSAATARFLEELGPIVRRNPEFLWSAATRLSKVVLVPELGELLAPTDGGLDVGALIRAGRGLFVRLPVATLGPEAAAFAATLVLGRIYLGLVGEARPSDAPGPVLLVLDEVQSFPPRLVSEILAEGRKFGVETLVATQYPERLAPELRAAAAGAATTFVAFRTPAATAATVGPWVGLGGATSAAELASLPTGLAIVLDPRSASPRWWRTSILRPAEGAPSWSSAVTATRNEFHVSPRTSTPPEDDGAVHRLLLAVLAAEETGRPLAPSEVVRAAVALVAPFVDAAELERAWVRVVRGAECAVTPSSVRLTSAGEARLGLGAPTGAVSESSEHRALLLRAFRVFARRGHVIEIVRQGRFDTTLPDALFRQMGPSIPREPFAVARTLDRIRTGWAWRCFSGRDVHLEAEVSGALRPERIRRGWAKANARGAFALFLVGDAARARRVRRTLRSLGLAPDRAQVWTLGPSWTVRREVGRSPAAVEESVSPPSP